jgi:uncharacterized peroxidase-related enzyme
MTRIKPIRREDVPELDERYFKPYEAARGYVPNSNLVMARRPRLLEAFRSLNRAIFDPGGETPVDLLYMVGNVASQAAGCMYCAAHTANNARKSGLDAARIAALWEYETSPLFSDAERAALRFAQGAASVPNMVTDDDVTELKRYFSEDQIVDILAVVCWYGFLNRWNDSLATELEPAASEFAHATIAARGWTPGKHAPGKKG